MSKTVPFALRKPPETNPAAAEAFVRQADEPKRPALRDAAERKPKGAVARADGTEARRLVVYLPPETMQRLRVSCAERELSLSAAVTEALGSWLST
jgi:hypothetical protein